jgi:hypothetical protein
MKMIKIDKNLKYGLYFLAAFIGGFVIVKIIKAIKDGDDDDAPKPAEPNPPQTQGLTPLQKKQEELQSLLGFVGSDVDHIIGSKTITAYNNLNLRLGITLSQSTSLSDIQKIIDTIVKKNQSDSTNTSAGKRADEMVLASQNNRNANLKAIIDTRMYIVVQDLINKKYINTQNFYTAKPNDVFTRTGGAGFLTVWKKTTDFASPYFILFKNGKGQILAANPNDWILK